MIDTHCHLTHARLLGDLDGVISRAGDAGVEACISIGTGVEDAANVRELTRSHAGFVYGTAGLDPFTSHRLGDDFDDGLARLETLLEDGGFVALGEVGLDYHYELSSRAVQARQFEQQLELAVRLELPVVIHVREAHDDMAAILAAHRRATGVIHSFTAGPREASRYLELGWHLAFNGVLTFPKCQEVREAARLTSNDRLLIETDAPYLAPAPKRGRRCEPAFVVHTLEKLAETRGQDPDELGRLTSANARRLFGL